MSVRRIFAIWALALAVLLPRPAAAQADQQRERAQKLFEQGLTYAKEGDSASALAAFRAAHDTFPAFRVLYNIAQLCARMGDAACAVRAYERYLDDGGDEVPAKRRNAVQAEIKQLSRTLAMVTIKSSVSGADVTVDDELVGTTPLARPVALSAGTHKIALLHEGKRVEQSVKLVSGESAEVELEPKVDAPPEDKSAQDPGPTDPARDDKPSEAGPKEFPVVPWAITGALAAGTVVSAILASSAYGSYQDTRERFPITREELESSQGSARDLFLLTSALGVGTLVAAGVATWMTFASPAPIPPPKHDHDHGKVKITVAASGRGVSIVGIMP